MAKIDDSVKKKVPELRFPGFTDDWEERKLGEVGKTKSGIGFPDAQQGGKQGTPFYKVSDMNNPGNEVVMMNANNYASDSQLKENKWNPINPQNSGVVFAKVGAAIFLDRKRIVDTSFLIDNNMMSYLFDSSWNRYFGKTLFEKLRLSRFAQVGALPSFNGSDVEDIKVMIPKESEQKMIGSFFKQLDETIALHQRKLDLLKEQKKGYLQKMFPKNGAKVPELRFAGFADDWEERKLGEVIDIENGYAFKSEYFSDEEKRHIVLTPGSVKIGGGFQKDKGRYYDVSGVFPEKFIFKPGNIFITMTDLTPTAQSLGYPAIVPRDDNVYLHNQRLGKIINNTTNPEFLYTLLTTDTYHKEIVSSASGTTVKHSSVSKILDFKSAIPNIDEQKLIGSFFKELDNTIALHQRKLDLLKEQKKGFLQKMFV